MRRGTVVVLVCAVVVALGIVAAVWVPALAAPAIALPPVAARYDAQLGGSYSPPSGVRVVERDWHTRPAAGLYSICYVDVFQTQPEAKADWFAKRRSLLIQRDGSPIEDPNWPNQYLVDTSSAAKRAALASFAETSIARCARVGFQAVEFDNLDSYMRSGGLLTSSDNLALAATLAGRAHALGLAVGQKNAPELGAAGKRVASFDFAIAESCERYTQCDDYTRVYGDHVIEIEYSDNGIDVFHRACEARGKRISIEYRDRLVVPSGTSGHVAAWC